MRASNDTGNTKLMITRKKEMAGMGKEKESKVGRKGRNMEENQEEIKGKGTARFTVQSTTRHFPSHGEPLTGNLMHAQPKRYQHVHIAVAWLTFNVLSTAGSCDYDILQHPHASVSLITISNNFKTFACVCRYSHYTAMRRITTFRSTTDRIYGSDPIRYYNIKM